MRGGVAEVRWPLVRRLMPSACPWMMMLLGGSWCGIVMMVRWKGRWTERASRGVDVDGEGGDRSGADFGWRRGREAGILDNASR